MASICLSRDMSRVLSRRKRTPRLHDKLCPHVMELLNFHVTLKIQFVMHGTWVTRTSKATLKVGNSITSSFNFHLLAHGEIFYSSIKVCLRCFFFCYQNMFYHPYLALPSVSWPCQFLLPKDKVHSNTKPDTVQDTHSATISV